MRQQYHSKWVNGQRYVWDVNSLVLKVKNLPVTDVLLDNIAELDENYWFDQEEGPTPIVRQIALHAKLINDCDLTHPIILHADGSLMDGMHRCCKALIEGHKVIKAIQFKADPPPDFINPDWSSLPYNDNFHETLQAFGLNATDD